MLAVNVTLQPNIQPESDLPLSTKANFDIFQLVQYLVRKRQRKMFNYNLQEVDSESELSNELRMNRVSPIMGGSGIYFAVFGERQQLIILQLTTYLNYFEVVSESHTLPLSPITGGYFAVFRGGQQLTTLQLTTQLNSYFEVVKR